MGSQTLLCFPSRLGKVYPINVSKISKKKTVWIEMKRSEWVTSKFDNVKQMTVLYGCSSWFPVFSCLKLFDINSISKILFSLHDKISLDCNFPFRVKYPMISLESNFLFQIKYPAISICTWHQRRTVLINVRSDRTL